MTDAENLTKQRDGPEIASDIGHVTQTEVAS